MANDLIQAIKERQESEGLTLTQMSEKLGVAVSYLSMVYSGKRPPANKMLRGIVKHYPELTNLVSLFLLDDITDSPVSFTVGDTARTRDDHSN